MPTRTDDVPRPTFMTIPTVTGWQLVNVSHLVRVTEGDNATALLWLRSGMLHSTWSPDDVARALLAVGCSLPQQEAA